MIKAGKPTNQSQNAAELPNGGFQPKALIAAEIAFAALLLFLTNKPITISTPQLAENTPLITIELPMSNVAVASTLTTDGQQDQRNLSN